MYNASSSDSAVNKMFWILGSCSLCTSVSTTKMSIASSGTPKLDGLVLHVDTHPRWEPSLIDRRWIVPNTRLFWALHLIRRELSVGWHLSSRLEWQSQIDMHTLIQSCASVPLLSACFSICSDICQSSHTLQTSTRTVSTDSLCPLPHAMEVVHPSQLLCSTPSTDFPLLSLVSQVEM